MRIFSYPRDVGKSAFENPRDWGSWEIRCSLKLAKSQSQEKDKSAVGATSPIDNSTKQDTASAVVPEDVEGKSRSIRRVVESKLYPQHTMISMPQSG